MRRSTGLVLAVAAATAATAFAPLPADAPSTGNPLDSEVVQLAAEVITSPNVEYLGTLPIDSPGVGGAKVEHADGNTYFYVTGLKGLTIYDVSDPTLPMPVGFLPFYHAQNEDVSVSADGTRTIISADGSIAVPVAPLTRGVHVVDTSDPANPELVASHSDSNHTTECADPECNWLYGSSTAGIYDATRADEGIITRIERNYNVYTDASGNTASAGGRHASNLDESGLLTTDSNPRLVLDPREHTGADGTEYGPWNPEVLAVGFRNPSTDGRLQHNNFRPSATEWEPRDPEDPADAYDDDGLVTGLPAPDRTLPEGSLRPGELLIGNSETNLNPTCNMAGGLSTWDMRDFDKGRAPVQLDTFKPLNGNYTNGDPAANGLGCSGHWFTVDGEYVTASWYEHGVRFFEIGLDTGAIEEVGFFQPLATQAGAAYWITDEIVYSVDYARGIDILRFDREGERPSEEERVASWLANLGKVGQAAQSERYYCTLAFSD